MNLVLAVVYLSYEEEMKFVEREVSVALLDPSVVNKVADWASGTAEFDFRSKRRI